ncbi:MAG: hypothetical protein RIQ89_2061 [Bacteroidota bacterium]|jgi:ubiquinone/menaquinone biosynthesis C-methylase UbiE
MSSHERAHHDEANNVTYQRCQFAYEYAIPFIKGKNVLDVGCGLAYGTALMAADANTITGLDYDGDTIAHNEERYQAIKNLNFKQGTIPPIPFDDNSFDVITSFQFIEHIALQKEFLAECMRVLKPGGNLLVTTPNAKMSLARNPFHVHEYTFDEMRSQITTMCKQYQLKGLQGNETVNKYYLENGKWVRKILKWDVLGLHKILPAKVLAWPYNVITSLMRNKLKDQIQDTTHIGTKDFYLQEADLDQTWDIYLIATKNF